MNFDLPGDSSRRNAIRWLKQLIWHVGPGFHLDTAPNDYTLSEGRPLFTPSESGILERSLNRLLEILGSEQPYEIGANLTANLLCRYRGWKPHLQFHDPAYQRIGVGTSHWLGRPSLQTGRADFPHPAIQLIVYLRED